MQKIKRREIEQLPLAERLEKLIDADKILTDIQYDNVRDVMQTIVSESLEQNHNQLRLLTKNFMDRLMKKQKELNDSNDSKRQERDSIWTFEFIELLYSHILNTKIQVACTAEGVM